MNWQQTLVSLGIEAEFLRNRHGPCPGCGGKDRFRFDDKEGRGTFVCSQGGGEVLAGDGYDLLQHVHGWSFKTAKEAIEDRVGIIPSKPRMVAVPTPPKPSKTQPYAVAAWAGARHSDEAVAVHPYAQAKGIDWAAGAGRARASGKLIGQDADCIVIPVRKRGVGEVVAVEVINQDGKKQTFGPKSDGYLLLGCETDPLATWHMVEGWADAASLLRRSMNVVAIVAFGLGSFDRVAGAVESDHNPPALHPWMDAP